VSGVPRRLHLFDRPANVRRVIRALVAVCVILFALDAVLHRHVEHPWEGFFGFYAIYGFVACVLLVLLAKEMRKLLIRDEDYYERAEDRSAGGESTGRTDGGDV
jgi:hypothetical protein